MMFVNSLKLFGSNWSKTLKFVLYYIFVLGVCFAMLLPSFFEFKDLFVSNFQTTSALGVMAENYGQGIQNVILTTITTIMAAFSQNLGLAIYAIIVLFLILPFLVNIGKYTFCEMLYSYMTSKTKIGFFSAMIKSLKKSIPFSLCRIVYNWLFLAIIGGVVYALVLPTNEFFVKYCLVFVFYAVLVILFALNKIILLGWTPASIVFDVNVFSAFKKGIKAVKRHFWAIFGTTVLYFGLFWLLTFLLGAYSLIPMVVLMMALLSIYNMTVFFMSQGMRFYINDNKILTPKKLEEVDNINKTAFIL